MRKRIFVKLFVRIIVLICMSTAKGAVAEVNINVGINVPVPPPLVIPAPPPIFVIPGTHVYFAPYVDVEIFFCHGYWYRPYQGYWYRSGSYNGKWVYIAPKRVPSVLLNLLSDFRRVPLRHQHIPHGHLKKNWKTLEKERYWKRYEYGHEEKSEDLGHNRGRERKSR